ncbi:heterokaryon incompatibility protein-domain-containing protein [Clohesyomyces aquaticus]|uniref:Heterokaryon incompatibility protein-domain-containing protein n=1 Tax=Clohesyomyces aquaticus TaxID=1231657 RepID=A0A1Y1Z709_9PLEO|nr:heterokaryon incompatibility protein-domain-containing protein [Clohesyomyces aquaticus]
MGENTPFSHSYTPLKSTQHIRIIILEPSLDPNAPLDFSFHQASLPDLEAQYEAISYTWGAPILEHPLFCDDGTRVYVTINLECALKKLRYRASQRWLWADAVCINQRNDQEKATQIPLMVNIFRGAKRVLAWLGHGENGEHEAINFLGRLSRSPMISSGEDVRIDERVFQAVTRLLQLPWFGRLWIIQEVVFNTDVLLICGQAELSAIRLFSALSLYYKSLKSTNFKTEPAVIDKFQALDRVYTIWRSHCVGTPNSLTSYSRPHRILTLTSKFSSYACSDQRDRIFALYSMAGDICKPSLDPKEDQGDAILMDIDYSLDVSQTYQKFASAVVRSSAGHLAEVMRCILQRRSLVADKLWPSWVPDWRMAPVRDPLVNEDLFRELTGTVRQDGVGLRISVSQNDCIFTPDYFEDEGRPQAIIITEKGPNEFSSVRTENLLYSILAFFRNHICSRGLSNAAMVVSNMCLPDLENNTGAAEGLRLRKMVWTMLLDPIKNSQNSGKEVHSLLQAVGRTMNSRCLFSAAAPSICHGGAGTIIGTGPVELLPGDQLLISAAGTQRCTADVAMRQALVLRHDKGDSYRLVGDALLVLYDKKDCKYPTCRCHFVAKREYRPNQTHSVWGIQTKAFQFTLI